MTICQTSLGPNTAPMIAHTSRIARVARKINLDPATLVITSKGRIERSLLVKLLIRVGHICTLCRGKGVSESYPLLLIGVNEQAQVTARPASVGRKWLVAVTSMDECNGGDQLTCVHDLIRYDILEAQFNEPITNRRQIASNMRNSASRLQTNN